MAITELSFLGASTVTSSMAPIPPPSPDPLPSVLYEETFFFFIISVAAKGHFVNSLCNGYSSKSIFRKVFLRDCVNVF